MVTQNNSLRLFQTYNQDRQTPDSAGTATAFLSGIKTNYGVLGVDGRSRRGDCATKEGTEINSILHWSKDEGTLTIPGTTYFRQSPGLQYKRHTHYVSLMFFLNVSQRTFPAFPPLLASHRWTSPRETLTLLDGNFIPSLESIISIYKALIHFLVYNYNHRNMPRKNS